LRRFSHLFRLHPVVRRLAGAKNIKHVVDVDYFDIPAMPNESPEVLEIYSPVFGISDVPDKEVVPAKTLEIRLDIPSLKKQFVGAYLWKGSFSRTTTFDDWYLRAISLLHVNWKPRTEVTAQKRIRSLTLP
jgi:hypothetical protein